MNRDALLELGRERDGFDLEEVPENYFSWLKPIYVWNLWDIVARFGEFFDASQLTFGLNQFGITIYQNQGFDLITADFENAEVKFPVINGGIVWTAPCKLKNGVTLQMHRVIQEEGLRQAIRWIDDWAWGRDLISGGQRVIRREQLTPEEIVEAAVRSFGFKN